MADKINFMEGKKLEINNLLDGKGFVKVITVGPENCSSDRTPEYLIAKTARASYGQDNKSAKADKGLIEFLARNNHTSPFEMCSITYLLKIPIAMCRQLLRHRTGKFNEFSQRYTEVKEDMGRFELDGYSNVMRGKSDINHQASEFNLEQEQVEKIEKLNKKMSSLQDQVFSCYQELLEAGQAKELARFNLPLSTYTLIYVQFDLNNLIKFFNLRCADDAQHEIRVYSNSMRELAQQFFPVVIDIQDQYQGALKLGRYEKMMIKEGKIPEEVTSKSHQAHLRELAKELGIKLK